MLGELNRSVQSNMVFRSILTTRTPSQFFRSRLEGTNLRQAEDSSWQDGWDCYPFESASASHPPNMNSPKVSSSENQLRWWRAPGVIYFFAAGSPAVAIKIGVTTRATLLERMKKTQAHNHEPIELLGVIRFSDGDLPTRDAEDHARRLHARFSHLCRFKAHTRGSEWFTASPELLSLIAESSISPETLGFPRMVCTLEDDDAAV